MVLYVDDTLCTGEKEEVEWVYKQIEQHVKIERLGKLKKHLGIWYEWRRDLKGEIYLETHMPKIIKEISDSFEKATGKKAKEYDTPGAPGKSLGKNEGPVEKLDEYRSIVGKVMYLATKQRPDISNAVRELATHLANPGKEHWKALERCVGYLERKGSRNLILRRPTSLTSISDCDSDYANDPKDRKSISGRINTLGGMITSWTSKKQRTVSLSSSEAEYQALSECVQEAMFTKNLVKEITGEEHTAIIYEDNSGTIFLVKNQQVSARTKHIDIRHHYMRNLQKDKHIDIRFKRSENNSSDIMTKNTTKEIHEKHSERIRNGTLNFRKEDVAENESKQTLITNYFTQAKRRGSA